MNIALVAGLITTRKNQRKRTPYYQLLHFKKRGLGIASPLRQPIRNSPARIFYSVIEFTTLDDYNSRRLARPRNRPPESDRRDTNPGSDVTGIPTGTAPVAPARRNRRGRLDSAGQRDLRTGTDTASVLEPERRVVDVNRDRRDRASTAPVAVSSTRALLVETNRASSTVWPGTEPVVRGGYPERASDDDPNYPPPFECQ